MMRRERLSRRRGNLPMTRPSTERPSVGRGCLQCVLSTSGSRLPLRRSWPSSPSVAPVGSS